MTASVSGFSDLKSPHPIDLKPLGSLCTVEQWETLIHLSHQEIYIDGWDAIRFGGPIPVDGEFVERDLLIYLKFDDGEHPLIASINISRREAVRLTHHGRVLRLPEGRD